MSIAKDFINAQVQGKPVIDVLSFEYDYKKYVDKEKKIIMRHHHKFDGYLMATGMFDDGEGGLLYGSRVAIFYDKIVEKAIVFVLSSTTISSWCTDLLMRSILFSCDSFQHEIEELYSAPEDKDYIAKIIVKCDGLNPITSLQSDFVFSLPPLESFNISNFKNIQLHIAHNSEGDFYRSLYDDDEEFDSNYDAEYNHVKSELELEDYTLIRNPSGKSVFIHFM